MAITHPWIFDASTPTLGEMMDLATWTSLYTTPGAKMRLEHLAAVYQLMLSRDRSEPRHTLDDVRALDWDEAVGVITAMMNGMNEAWTTVALIEQFRKKE